MKDCTCNMTCPMKSSVIPQPICCYGCHKSRRCYLTDANKKYWDDKVGFWSSTGCRLPRAEMPVECKEYDCHDYVWCMKMVWESDKWIYTNAYELLPGLDMAIVPKAMIGVIKNEVPWPKADVTCQ